MGMPPPVSPESSSRKGKVLDGNASSGLARVQLKERKGVGWDASSGLARVQRKERSGEGCWSTPLSAETDDGRSALSA
jgi:hypothetical protein